MNWTARAATLSGGNWLYVSPASGTVTRPMLDVRRVDIIANTTTLGPGQYTGKIEVTAPSDNSPQIVTVYATVLPAGSTLVADVYPASLLFIGNENSAPGAQFVRVTNLQNKKISYSSARYTEDGGPWLFHLPSSATILPEAPFNMMVQPEFAGLRAGLKRGTVNLQFEGNVVRPVRVLTVVAPAGSGGLGKDGRRLAAACKQGDTLRVAFTSIWDGFEAVAGEPTTVEARVVDDCGNLLVPESGASASAIARFFNRDPELRLVHTGNGTWTGTWRPLNVVPEPVMVKIYASYSNASARVFQAGEASVVGTVRGGRTPVVRPSALLDAASFVKDAPVAPGGLITLFGEKLADRPQLAGTLPLPTDVEGTEVLLGGRRLPLWYTSEGQINAQVPYDLPVDTQHQIVVQRGDTLSVPEQFTVAAANPGIFSKNQQGFGQGVIMRADQRTLAEPGTPAERGETIVIYCAGLGAVDPPVEPGRPAPPLPPPGR